MKGIRSGKKAERGERVCSRPRVKILDCTVRDGGYVNDWRFDEKMVREIYRSVSQAGVDIVEIGFRGSSAHFDPMKFGAWRFSDEATIERSVRGLHGARIAVMADYGKVSADDFSSAKESAISLVRVASHKDGLVGALRLIEKIKKKGYRTALNAMGYSNYTSREQKGVAALLKRSPVDIVYVVDSYGSLFPNEIRRLVEPLLALGSIEVGFHPHNSLQMAFANSLEAIRAGVHYIDTTLYGMGRGAGNLPTEILVLYMELLGLKRYNVIPLLNCIDTYLMPLAREFEWGYQLPFMLSGMYRCHPNYAKKLVEMREYTIEDICRAMELIQRRAPVGFSPDVLKEVVEGGAVGRGAVLFPARRRKGAPKTAAVPYINRHKGRDFLILANGPTLTEYREKIKAFIAKVSPVVMGANNLSGLFVPDYHAFNNKRRFMHYADTVSKSSRLLLSCHFPEEFIREYTDAPFERLYYRDILNAHFDIRSGVVQTNCRTISVLLIAIAIAMGARRIFVAGMDGYLSGGASLFYNEKDEKTDRGLIIERHRWCQSFLAQINQYLIGRGREGVHILTPTSYKTFYKGIENYLETEGAAARARREGAYR